MIAGILYEHIKSYTYKRERVLRMSKFKEYEKFMHLKKLIIPTITVLVLTSQLCGCATASSKEAMNMIRNNESIEITVAEPASSTSKQGTETYIPWIELAYLTTYPDLRADMDDSLYIIPMQDGKNGCIYVDSEGNHNNNTTLKDAFNNKKFVQDFWNNTEVSQAIITSSKQTFSDVETDQEALLAAYNAYYNLLPDGADPSSANMQSTLTRLEAMALVYKADTPVNHDLQPSSEYLNLLGASASAEASDSSKADLVLFAEQIDKSGNSYLTLSNNSLDQSTATGTMTRAEFIYLLVQRYFGNDYNTLTDESIKASSKVIAYTDLTNAGNVAKKQKYITTEKNPDTGKKEEVALNRYQAYELNYCLQNADKGLTEPLYKAYIIASQKGILPDEEETNWDIGLTKEYALDVLFNTLESIGSKVRYDRGEAHGEIVESADISGSESSASADSSAGATTNGQLETPSNTLTEEEGAYYIKENADGSREYSPYLITDVMGDSRFSGLTYDEVVYFLDSYLDPKYDKTDEDIRFVLSCADRGTVESILGLGKEQSAVNQGQQQSSNSNQSTNQSQSSNQNTTQTPQPSGGGLGLTQEQMDAIKAENEAAGNSMSIAPEFDHTGESWDGRKYN